MITALTINYNTPELLENLLSSFRQFYDIPFMVVDGSDDMHFALIKYFPEKFKIDLHHFNCNIHHGPGMAYGFTRIKTKQILTLDSDVRILKGGFIEDLQSKLRPDSYGIGSTCIIDRDGIASTLGIKYLHPSCALINHAVALKFALPIRHGAPMISTMQDIAAKRLDILQHEEWVASDMIHAFRKEDILNRFYINHEWCGTIKQTGGMNL
jgi:hypothetical protein